MKAVRPRYRLGGAVAVVVAVGTAVVAVPAIQHRAEPVSATVDVVATRVDREGYDRSCKGDHGCVFGQACRLLATQVPRPIERVKITRNDILRRDLTEIVIKSNTRGCVVLSGLLEDPYTGQQVIFQRGRNTRVHIDHVFPLAAGWDHGAADWPAETRRDVANDAANLVATSSMVNLSKGDQAPGEWMPAHDRCGYARRYLDVRPLPAGHHPSRQPSS